MVRKHEYVIVNDHNMGLVDEEMVVLCTSEDAPSIYKSYLGEDVIIAEDKQGTSYALNPHQYKEKFSSIEEFQRIVFDNVSEGDAVKLSDIIIPKQRDKGTKRLFYSVVDVHRNGVSFYDDFDKKRTYPLDQIEIVDKSNWMQYFIDLQDQIHSLRELVVQSFELTSDDIQKKLEEFKS